MASSSLEKNAIEFRYGNRQPISLRDLTAGLNGFADEYRRLLKRMGSNFSESKSQLFVTQVRSGSIIATLTPMIPVVQGLVETNAHINDFGNYLVDSYNYLLGTLKARPPFTKRNLENLRDIVEPTAKEPDSYFIFTGPATPHHIKLSTAAAREIKRNVRIELDKLKEPKTGLFENMNLYWYQARNDRHSSAGDRAVIAELDTRPVKTLFSSEALKRKMLLELGNPFQIAYDVDIIADFKGSKAQLYKIQRLNSIKPLT